MHVDRRSFVRDALVTFPAIGLMLAQSLGRSGTGSCP